MCMHADSTVHLPPQLRVAVHKTSGKAFCMKKTSKGLACDHACQAACEAFRNEVCTL